MEAALDKMMMTDQHQHSDGLLQEFYTMTQRANEPIGKYAVQLNLAAGKVRLQSQEALGSREEERGRLLMDRLLWSMNPKLQGRVAHMVDGKAIWDQPNYWQLVKFAVEKKAEINFDDARKVAKPKVTMHFKYDWKRASLPVNPTVWMAVATPEEDPGLEDNTPPRSEDSDSGESYKAPSDDVSISTGDIEITVRVAHASEAFSGRCFHCGKEGHRF